MFLKSLTMQGFKSFPERTTLNFEKGVTGVVGPNGSGKSNISDAIRWVLGEQSSKSLRGSKMEDVIFDGTKKRKPYGFAQVTLTLDNTDRAIEKIDEDEVCVSRKYFRSGESEYRINGEPVRLKDVHELFMDTGLGRDGYSMVSQGRVADLISDRSSGCKQMLEEAAGISAYRYRRSDSLRQLEKAEENMLRLLDILKELKERVGPLKIQSEKAQKFLEYSAEKKENEIRLWLADIKRLQEQLKKHEASFFAAKAQHDDSEKMLESIGAQIEQAIEANQKATAEIERLNEEAANSDAQSAALSGEIAVHKNSIDHNSFLTEKLQKELANNKNDREQLVSEIKTQEKVVSKINSILTEKQLKLNEISSALAAARSEGSSIESDARELNVVLNELSEQQSAARIEESKAESLFDELMSRDNSLLERRKDLESSLQLNQKQRDENTEQIRTVLSEITEQSNVCAGVEMLLESHEKRLNEQKEQNDEQNFSVSAISSRIRMLEDLEKDMEGYSGAVKAVLAAADRHALTGIEGTVSKLISVDAQNALAVETALGGAVQHIICQSENDAKRAVEFLKSGNHGRATFQPISSVKGKRMAEPELFDCDGFVGIASELVETDKAYSGVIESLLGRIAVAEDLSYAIKIAKKFSYRFKIVTLDGQVVNAGGSVTGGSKAKIAGIISRTIEIKELAEKRQKILKNLAEGQKKLAELQTKVNSEREQVQQAKDKIVSLTEERIRLEGVKKLFDRQREDAENAIKELETEANELEQRRLGAKRMQDEQSELIKSINSEISNTESKLVALAKKQNDLSASGEEIAEQINTLRNEIHTGERDLASHTARVDMLKLQLIEGEEKDKSIADEAQQLLEQNEKLRSEIKRLEYGVERLRLIKLNKEEAAAAARAMREDAQKRTTQLRQEEKAESDTLQELSARLARLEERKAKAEEEYDSTLTRLYDEYELSLRAAQEQYSIPEDVPATRRRVNELKNKIRSLGTVNVAAIEEYKEVRERYEFMNGQLEDVKKSKAELTRLINELTQKMSEQFREKFNQINESFAETFASLFGGGTASLVITDETDILESDVEIKLQPPGKAIKRLDSLSGGEKGLSSIALLFAILKVNPAPFCIFDEVEAALDESNVSRYAQYVRRMSDNTQFILITHRRGSMEEADRLYGITMQEQGVSKLLELNTAQLASELGIK